MHDGPYIACDIFKFDYIMMVNLPHSIIQHIVAARGVTEVTEVTAGCQCKVIYVFAS